MKKLLTFFLTALLAFSVGWAETVTDVLNLAFTGVTGTSYTEFSGKTGTSGAVYAGQCAGGYSSIQLRSTSPSGIITTASGGKVKKITVAWNANTAQNRVLNIYGKNSAYSAASDLYSSSSQGTLLGTITKTTANATAGTGEFTVSGDYEYIGFRSNSGAQYITSITIVWETGGGNAVAAPTISPAGGNFGGSQVVTLSHADADAIYYTLDGSDPTTSSTLYNAPFTITSTTTVKAIAVKDGVVSTVASATFTEMGVGTIAAAYALDQNSQFVFTGSAVVTYQNGNNLWIRDASGSGLIYGSVSGTFANGDILDAGWAATNYMYGAIPEFSNPTRVASNSNGGTVAPIDMTSTGITTGDVNKYVSFSSIAPTYSNTEQYAFVTINGNKFYFRDYFNLGLTIVSGHTYNIEGIAYIYQNNAYVYMTALSEVVSSDPTIFVSPNPMTFNDSGTGNTITVEGSNLGGDNVGLTQSGSYFTPTLSATVGTTYDGGTYWGFTPANGSVNGTVAMSYTGRDLSASETVTLANNKASATVTVNYRSDVYILGNYGGNGWDYSNGILMTYDATNNTYTASVTAEVGDLIVFARKLGESNPWNSRILFGPNSDGDWWVNSSPNPKEGTIDLNDDDPIYFNSAGTYIIEINATTGALTLTKVTAGADDFVLVTDTEDVDTSGEYVLVYTNSSNEDHAMSTAYTSSYYGQTTEGFSRNVNIVTLENPTTVNVITLEDAGNGSFYIKAQGTDNDYYLYYNSGNNVHRSVNYNSSNNNFKWNITISDDKVVIRNAGATDRYLQYNASSPRYSCYTNSQQNAKLYKHGGSPSITVNPGSMDLVIPVGSSSVEGAVTVTERNTTGTTSVSINGDTNIFSATLNNGTLTVTYSGTATQANPDQATITLTNGTATATVTVTGYKLPMTVTITPADGHTFQGSTVTGIIESNVADATIEYSFDGTNWTNYDANDGFTTPEVSSVGGTVTVYARATYNGETATTQVTYTRIAESTTCSVEIVFDPTFNDDTAVSNWSDLQNQMTSESVDYISDATMSNIFANNTYDAMRFGARSTIGQIAFSLDLTKFEGGACKLTKVTINAARYSNDTGCELNVSTNVNTTGVTQTITAGQDNFADYVFTFDGSEIESLTITNSISGSKRVYVHSITLEYNCEISLRLEDLVEVGVENHTYKISNQLHAAAVTWDADRNMFAIFAKDDHMYANKRYPADGQETYLIRYENQSGTFINTVEQEDYDQSNWIEILIPSTITEVTSKTDVNAYIQKLGELQGTFKNQILNAGSIHGTYVDALNPTIQVTALPTVATASTYEPNIYCTANFLMVNLNEGAQGDDGKYYFMMDAKPHEFCKVVWCWYDSDNDNYFVVPAREGNVVNGHDFHGSFMANMSLCEDYQVYYDLDDISTWFLDSDDESYGGQQMLYGFDAIVRKNPNADEPSGAPRRISEGQADFERNPAYIVYPLNAGGNSSDNVVSVKEILGNKTIESVHYYNTMGMESKTPFEGINIVVTRYTDGSTSTMKVMK